MELVCRRPSDWHSHMSYRADRLFWGKHRFELFVAALMIFWVAAIRPAHMRHCEKAPAVQSAGGNAMCQKLGVGCVNSSATWGGPIRPLFTETTRHSKCCPLFGFCTWSLCLGTTMSVNVIWFHRSRLQSRHGSTSETGNLDCTAKCLQPTMSASGYDLRFRASDHAASVRRCCTPALNGQLIPGL